jgi:ferrous iron transport protein B
MSKPTIRASSPSGTPRLVAVAGNPNSGKTTLFNTLTGLRAKVGNYPGVTVERKEGRMLGVDAGAPVTVLDLPGTYSLSPHSPDEEVTRDVLLHRLSEVPPPDVLLVVVDASNLQRNLYFTTQVAELGCPTVVALNMADVARENGHEINAPRLAAELGVPVVPVVATTGEGFGELRQRILEALRNPTAFISCRAFYELPEPVEREVRRLASQLGPAAQAQRVRAEALLLLSDDRFVRSSAGQYSPALFREVTSARARLEDEGVDWRSAAIESRYRSLSVLHEAVAVDRAQPGETMSDRLDRFLTHKVWGLLVFCAILAVMFQTIFSLARIPMEGLEHGVNWLGQWVSGLMPPGALRSLLVDGVISGVGAVMVFLPQICLLFLFLGGLEDSGYMSRAAFLMDRVMAKVGLHGKSFIPMLSSFACAIPGIMATRTIEGPRDRLVTIMVAPLMSCSARLPVFTVLIAACIPDLRVFGWLKLPGLVLLSLYLLGVLSALGMAWLFKNTLLRGPAPMLIMELPPYRRPLLRTVLRHVWERSAVFLSQAGTIILGINIVLWFLVSYPTHSDIRQQYAARREQVMRTVIGELPEAQAARKAQLTRIDVEERGETLRNSFAGWLGRVVEPTITPLGFDWKIGIGLLTSFAAREVFVSTMSQVYSVKEDEEGGESGRSLVTAMRDQKRPDGTPLYTVRLGLALMVFYLFAMQCASTVAIVRRETNSWKWPVIQWLYMGVLAWCMAFLTFQGGKLLGLQ